MRAVDGISLVVDQCETLGLVGEGGCGNSTLGQTIVGLHRATGGGVHFAPQGASLSMRSPREAIRRGNCGVTSAWSFRIPAGRSTRACGCVTSSAK
ncbi:MAG: ATP-binding cassette domain-containing protein [Candidatus Devosia euplotis]|nr:ATP-binding cassette domain-containing protein [Candidatus Devosia euplotis]